MIFNGPSFGIGFAAGFGTGFFARELVAFGGAALRPLARACVKAGMAAYERGRETLANVGESFEDLVAEARSELTKRKPAGDVASEAQVAAKEAAQPGTT